MYYLYMFKSITVLFYIYKFITEYTYIYIYITDSDAAGFIRVFPF